MHLIRFTIVLATTLAASRAWGEEFPADVLAALQKADRFELYSLDPDIPDVKPKNDFHGWKVLGKTLVKDAAARKKLVAALQKGVAENDGVAAGCFNPRHGIRVIGKNKTVELVICFECLQVQVFVGGQARQGFLTTESPQPAFDKILTDAGVPLPKKPKE
jgi:hypothetical protein